jgi:hypothetical protein
MAKSKKVSICSSVLEKKDPLLVLVNEDVVNSFTNDNYIKLYIRKEINDILKELYEPLGCWLQNPHPQAKKGHFGVVIDGKWSPLNQVDTNYSCHVVLFNRCNNFLLQQYRKLGLEEITIDGEVLSYKNQFQFDENYHLEKEVSKDKVRKLLLIIRHNKNKIFLSGNQIHDTLVSICRDRMKRGDERQEFYIEHINDFFNDITNIVATDGSGNSADMIEGIDVWTTHTNLGNKTHQVKGTCDIVKVSGGYEIKASVSESSKCNYFVFVCGRQRIMVFRTDYSKINFYKGMGVVFFSEDLLHLDLKY